MTATATTVASTQNEKAKVDAFEVGWLFVQEYYTFLNRDPQRLHCFYNKKSSFLHGHEGEATAKTCHGQQEIHSRIVELDFQDCKVLVSNVDSQASLNGGIVVQVLGEMSNKGGASHKFAQTFFLAEQPNGYYVLNDIFRFLKEDIDNEYEEAEDPTGGLEIQEHYVHEEPAAPVYQEPAPTEPEPRPATPRKAIEKARSPSPFKEERAPTPEVKPVRIEEPHVPETVPSPDTYGLSGWGEPAAQEAAPEPKAAWGSATKPKASTPSQEHAEPKKPAQPAASSQAVNGAPAKQPTPAPVPATPSKPKTWASLAATNASNWGPDASPAKPQVTPPQTHAKPSASQRPASPQKPAAKPVEKEESERPAAETATSEPKDGGFREVQNRQHKRAPQGVQQQQNDDREAYSIYIRGITDAIDKPSLLDTFSKVGKVRNIDLVPTKSIAFVEFTTVEAAQKAIGNSFTVNGQTIMAEERRKPRTYVNGPRGQYQQRRDFHDGGARGRGGDGFHGRGGMQGNRGRGGFGGPQKPAATGKVNGNKQH